MTAAVKKRNKIIKEMFNQGANDVAIAHKLGIKPVSVGIYRTKLGLYRDQGKGTRKAPKSTSRVPVSPVAGRTSEQPPASTPSLPSLPPFPEPPRYGVRLLVPNGNVISTSVDESTFAALLDYLTN